MVRIKKTYNGIITTRSRVESAPMLDASKVKLKAKTKTQDWKKEDIDKEMGIGDMTISDISTSARGGSWDTEF